MWRYINWSWFVAHPVGWSCALVLTSLLLQMAWWDEPKIIRNETLPYEKTND